MSELIEKMKIDLPFNLADIDGACAGSHVALYRQLIDELYNDNVELKYSYRYEIARIALLMHEERELAADLAENGDMITMDGDKGSVVTKRNQARSALEKVRGQLERLTSNFKMNPKSTETGPKRQPKAPTKSPTGSSGNIATIPRRASV